MAERTVLDFVKFLEIGSKNLQMYSESHPSTKRAMQDAFDSVSRVLETRESLTISISEGNLLIDGEVTDRSNPILERLRKELSERNIFGMVISRGVTMQELVALFRHLLLKPQRVRDLGGFEKILADEGVQFIQINKVKYVLQGDGVVAGLDPSSVSVEIFRSLSPDVQSRLLLAAYLADTPEQSSGFHRELSAEELQNAILRMLDEPIPVGQLKDLAQRLMKESDVEISEEMAAKMREKGILSVAEEPVAPPSPSDALLTSESWSIEKIASVPGVISDLLGQDKLQEADQISKKLFSLLGAGQPEQKIATIEVLPATIRALAKHEKWKNIDFSLSFLISTCYKKETSLAVLKAYVPMLLAVFMKKYEEQNWTACQDVLSTIRTQTEKQDSLKQEFAESWIKIAQAFIEPIREASAGVEIVLDGFRTAGGTGLSYLIEMLVDEEDQKVRSRLIGHVVSFRSDVVLTELEKRMTDDRWFVVRNMVTIVSKMPGGELPEFLKYAASHPDLRVAKELIKILYRGTAKSQLPLILLLLDHPERSMRIQTVHLVTMQANSAAIPSLVKLLEQGNVSETDVRTACFQALLKLRSMEAIIPAANVLERKPSSKAELAERNAAVRLLGELAREQTRTVLEKTAQNDPFPETRALAASYL
jgi:hypothetical protein